MRELEEKLVAYYYGEASNRHEIERLLAEDESVRKEFENLSALLDSVQPSSAPRLDASFGERMWERVDRSLQAERREAAAIKRNRQWMAVAACLLVGLAGMGYLQWRTPEPAVVGLSDGARQRLLLLAVAEHFDRSHLLLAELINAPGAEVVDVSRQKETAAELLAENRLYQQTARLAQRHALLFLLEEIERVLIELRNAPARSRPADLDRLRESIEGPGLLFKIQIFQADDHDGRTALEEAL